MAQTTNRKGEPMTTTAMKRYTAAATARCEIISSNRSRLLRGLSTQRVPAKPARPMGFEVYVDGDWIGFHDEDDREAALHAGREFATDGERVTVRRKPRYR